MSSEFYVWYIFTLVSAHIVGCYTVDLLDCWVPPDWKCHFNSWETKEELELLARGCMSVYHEQIYTEQLEFSDHLNFLTGLQDLMLITVLCISSYPKGHTEQSWKFNFTLRSCQLCKWVLLFGSWVYLLLTHCGHQAWKWWLRQLETGNDTSSVRFIYGALGGFFWAWCGPQTYLHALFFNHCMLSIVSIKYYYSSYKWKT